LVAVNIDVEFFCNDDNGYVAANSMKKGVNVTCPDTGIFPSSNWGVCQVHCPVPEAQTGFDEHAEEGQLKLLGSTIAFQCTGANKYVVGTVSPTKSSTCGADGTFALNSLGCETRCSTPSPGATYAAQADSSALFYEGDPLTFTCINPNGYNPDSNPLSHDLTLTCAADGTFPTAWPACINKCEVPTVPPGAGFIQADQSELKDPGAEVIFNCSNDKAYAGRAPDEKGYVVKCGSQGTTEMYQIHQRINQRFIRYLPVHGLAAVHRQVRGTAT